jgi:hypothetical protein
LDSFGGYRPSSVWGRDEDVQAICHAIDCPTFARISLSSDDTIGGIDQRRALLLSRAAVLGFKLDDFHS